MMKVIEISESKVENLVDNIGKSLRYLGDAMTCLDEMQRESQMGERRNYDYRDGRYGNRDGGYNHDMGERGGYGYRRY